jgi:hypothetical protein
MACDYVAEEMHAQVNSAEAYGEHQGCAQGNNNPQHRGRKARANAVALEAKVLEWTRRGPDDGSTQWSSRRLARKLGIGHMTRAGPDPRVRLD